MDITVNYVAVLVAAIVNMGLGMFWYSPAGFGKEWMRLSGLTQEHMEKAKAKGMGKTYAAAFVGSLVMAYVLAHFVARWGVVNASGAWEFAFWTWLGFVAPVMLGMVLWEGKPVKLYVINVAYYLVSLFAMALVLGLWQ